MHERFMAQRALALHRAHRGKLEIHSVVPLRNRRDLSLAYTPGVAAVCRAIAADPEQADCMTMRGRTVAVITDGSAILGLGNLGARAALPVMEGKAILLKAFGGVDAIPICLDTQNVDEIVRTVRHIAPAFAGINLEDIAAPRCFAIERRLQRILDIPVFHDDQHGTATVVLAGLINALFLRRLRARDARVVVNGAGAAGTAVTKLLFAYGFRRVTVVDRNGIIYRGRPKLSAHKRDLARLTGMLKKPAGGTRLEDALRAADVFIGVSAGNVLSSAAVRTMHPHPVIFALANPVPEIAPPAARRAGASIIATGRSDFPNQINNLLAFPGIFRGAIDHGVRRITDAMLIDAARRIAACVRRPSPNAIVPSVFDPRVARAVARAIRP